MLEMFIKNYEKEQQRLDELIMPNLMLEVLSMLNKSLVKKDNFE
jgi:hypothetical protein